MNEKGQGVDFEFIVTILITVPIALLIGLSVFNALSPNVVEQILNLEGDFDVIILLIFTVIPLALIAGALKTALRGKPRQPEYTR